MEGVDKREAAYVFSIKKKEGPCAGEQRTAAQQPAGRKTGGRAAQPGPGSGQQRHHQPDAGHLHAAVTVEEKTFTYVTKSRVSLQVIADFQGSKLTKQFNMSSSKEGPGEPSMADLESTLNQQLGSVLQQIMADEALRGLSQGSAELSEDI
jgi:uncharacterized lipoprotein